MVVIFEVNKALDGEMCTGLVGDGWRINPFDRMGDRILRYVSEVEADAMTLAFNRFFGSCVLRDKQWGRGAAHTIVVWFETSIPGGDDVIDLSTGGMRLKRGHEELGQCRQQAKSSIMFCWKGDTSAMFVALLLFRPVSTLIVR